MVIISGQCLKRKAAMRTNSRHTGSVLLLATTYSCLTLGKVPLSRYLILFICEVGTMVPPFSFSLNELIYGTCLKQFQVHSMSYYYYY